MDVPPQIGKLRNLQELNLNFQKPKLSGFPVEFCELENLKKVGLQDSNLKRPPPDIVRLCVGPDGNVKDWIPMIDYFESEKTNNREVKVAFRVIFLFLFFFLFY